MMSGLQRFLLILTAWLGVVALAQPGEATPVPPPSAEQQVLILLKLPAQHFRSTTGYADSYGDGASRSARRRIAGRIAREHGLKLVTDWPMPLVGLDCYVMAVPAGQSPETVAAELSRDRAVEWSEPMHVYAAQAAAAPRAATQPAAARPAARPVATAPNDPLFRAQPAAREWRLEALHDLATGRGVTVAVIDSAVDARHPDLAGQIEYRQDFVPARPATAELHGTAVAGVIAAVQDNQIGIVGVAPGARLMALRACWQQDPNATLCDTLSLAKAVHYAVDHSAQVINLSLAGPPDMLLGRLLDVAMARGIVVVTAVDPNLPGGGFPASHKGVVAVTLTGSPAPGAVAAPGRDIPTTEPGGRWGLVNGSSYSAAHVSGLFALMRERSRRGGAVTLVSAGGSIDACATLSRSPCGVRPVALSAAPRP